MTCDAARAARAARAALMLACTQGHITPDQLATAYTRTKETDMRFIFHPPTAGDIGEEEEEWEVLPDHQPIETPAPAPTPVPA